MHNKMVADGNAKATEVLAESDAHNGSKPNGLMSGEDAIKHDVPVLIAGGGPSGLLLAYMLSRLGGLSLFIYSRRRKQGLLMNSTKSNPSWLRSTLSAWRLRKPTR
jgi:hypothetical protein